ncbi:YcxB family protein [Dactylosporangium cerinum]|uniref:YcxB family protein n=1 Tax=Dactylosporangium cerinum TaxID=1434730 RepID=A0ABV9W675_9ACTN
MQISMWVPYDEARLRRTITLVMRPQIRIVRVLGGVIVALGLFLLAFSDSVLFGALFTVLGVLFMTALGPFTAARAVSMQSRVIKDGFQMTITEEWLTVVYPLAESRFRWAGIDNIVETPEAWYLMAGRAQSFTIPKDAMTDEQRAEFATFLTAERERQAGRAFLN